LIISFADKTTEDLFHGINSKHARKLPVSLHRIAIRKLEMIDAAEILEDLRLPPGNRLEALSGDLKNRYSIRINDQWRIIFKWTGYNVEEVEIIDYH
jgi:toxin HigB-1